jgi:hypothetical protein
MSAFMVCKSHIDQLVNVAYYGPKKVPIQSDHWYRPYFRDRELNNDQLNDLGEMFVKENLSSIHSRYPDTLTILDDTPGPRKQYWLAPYVFERPSRRMTAVEALKAISCYEYQSCEHEEWERSEAHRFCETLRDSLITKLPGYEKAAWTYDEVSNG